MKNLTEEVKEVLEGKYQIEVTDTVIGLTRSRLWLAGWLKWGKVNTVRGEEFMVLDGSFAFWSKSPWFGTAVVQRKTGNHQWIRASTQAGEGVSAGKAWRYGFQEPMLLKEKGEMVWQWVEWMNGKMDGWKLRLLLDSSHWMLKISEISPCCIQFCPSKLLLKRKKHGDCSLALLSRLPPNS